MSITINTKNFGLQSQAPDSVTYAHDTAPLNAPYTVRQSRVLPKASVKNSVLRGNVKFSRTFLDANNDPQVVIVTVSSSIPVSTPAALLQEMEADFEAGAVNDGVVNNTLFRGKIY